MRRTRGASRPAVLLVHGGAGGKRLTAAQADCIRRALMSGFALLRRRASALDVVEDAIRNMELSGLFNAGIGSRLQLDGARRMDAALMEGLTLRAGAVAGLEEIRHPISAARIVMDHTAHVLLIGPHATRLAHHFKLDRLPPPKANLRPIPGADINRKQQETLRLHRAMARCGTVGAVALDLRGTLAAGASTGGIALMLPGRVGDTPLIGCGVYADNEAGAVSMTGIGESIIRLALAKDIVSRLADGNSPATAAREAISRLVRRIGARYETDVGALVVAPDGRFTIRHRSQHMAAGYWTGTGEPVVADKFS